jgi:hypothetical protein
VNSEEIIVNRYLATALHRREAYLLSFIYSLFTNPIPPPFAFPFFTNFICTIKSDTYICGVFTKNETKPKLDKIPINYRCDKPWTLNLSTSCCSRRVACALITPYFPDSSILLGSAFFSKRHISIL